MSDEKFYILDARTVVGNCAMWWCPDGHGYTCEISEAGIFTHDEAFSKRETDVPVPASLIRAMTIPHVRLDRLRDRFDIRGYEKTRSRAQREAWWAKQQEIFVAAHGDDTPMAVICAHCHERPIVCVGRYEGHGAIEGACDTCCGHGNEDGWCIHLDDHEEIIAAFERDRLFAERLEAEQHGRESRIADAIAQIRSALSSLPFTAPEIQHVRHEDISDATDLIAAIIGRASAAIEGDVFSEIVERRIERVIGRRPSDDEVIVGPFLVSHDHPLASDDGPATAAMLQAQVDTMRPLLEEIRPLFAAFPTLASLVPRIDQAIHGPLTITFAPTPGLAKQILDALNTVDQETYTVRLRKIEEVLERGGA